MFAALKRYAEFQGRSDRKEYWLWVLTYTIGGVIAAAVDLVLLHRSFGPVSALFMLASLVPSAAVSVRRLHDTGRSGWWTLLAFVPILGTIWLLVLFLLDSDRKTNKYGSRPGARPAPEPASRSDNLDKLEKMAELKAKGLLTDDEFNSEKAKLLGREGLSAI